jgi:hypothetical protein
MADFARDLGYLDKFLVALRAHAGTLGAGAGARLAALLDEEERRWAEIRALLSGAPTKAPAAPAAEPADAAPGRAADSGGDTGRPHPGRRLRLQLTVGSLVRVR